MSQSKSINGSVHLLQLSGNLSEIDVPHHDIPRWSDLHTRQRFNSPSVKHVKNSSIPVLPAGLCSRCVPGSRSPPRCTDWRTWIPWPDRSSCPSRSLVDSAPRTGTCAMPTPDSTRTTTAPAGKTRNTSRPRCWGRRTRRPLRRGPCDLCRGSV